MPTPRATEEENNELYAQVQQIISDEAVNGFLFLLPGLTVTKADIASVPRTGGSLSRHDLTTIGYVDGHFARRAGSGCS